MKTLVLIVIDMLNDFLAKWEPGQRQRLVHAVNELVRIMRGASCPILWVRQEFEPDLRDAFLEMRAKRIETAIKGTPGCQIVAELALAPSEPIEKIAIMISFIQSRTLRKSAK